MTGRALPPSAMLVALRRRQPEAALQTQVCHFLSLSLDGNSWYTAIPLGGGGRLRGAQLKRTGTKPGVPDILVTNDGRAIWLELKTPRGALSDAQRYCHEQIKRARCPVYIVRSIDDVIAALQAAGVPLRAKVAT
jgi:hypothetical protein